MRNLWKLCLCAVVLGAFFSGCSVKMPHSQFVTYNPQITLKKRKAQLLVKRFIEYWDSRVRGDAKKSWEYELPYQKYLTTFEIYRKELGGYGGSKITLAGIDFIDEDRAILKRRVYTGKRVIDKKDQWIYVKDNWYHKFYQSILPPKTREEADFQ